MWTLSTRISTPPRTRECMHNVCARFKMSNDAGCTGAVQLPHRSAAGSRGEVGALRKAAAGAPPAFFFSVLPAGILLPPSRPSLLLFLSPSANNPPLLLGNEQPSMQNVIAASQAPGQTIPMDDTQVLNNAGGYVFKIDDMTRLRRFLILGSESGNYYVTKDVLQFENAQCIVRLLALGKGLEVIKEIVEISTEGRAAKQTAGIYALAMCARLGDKAVRSAALTAVQDVCRTASTLFEFVEHCQQLGEIAGAANGVEVPKKRASWGRGMRRAVAAWYLARTPRDVAYQVTKYPQRHGWKHRDLLRLAHPMAAKGEGMAKAKGKAKQQGKAGPSGGGQDEAAAGADEMES